MISDETAVALANRWRPTRTLSEQEWAALAVWVRAYIVAAWDDDALAPRGLCLYRLIRALGWADHDVVHAIYLVNTAGWPPETAAKGDG